MVSVCVLMAGSGQRCHINQNKVLYKINNTTLYMYSVLQFIKSEEVEEVITYNQTRCCFRAHLVFIYRV